MEHLIDIFARDPNSLSETDRDRIDALLAENPAFREYLNHLKDFYRSFREMSTEDVPDHVRAFADSLVRLPRRLRLRPPRERNGGNGRGPGYRFLRADSTATAGLTGSDDSGVLKSAGSLVSPDYGVLLRFIEDGGASELRGYVLSPDQNDASSALVEFEGLSAPVAADDAGVIRVSLADISSTEELLGGVVELMLPEVSTMIRPADLDPLEYTRLFESAGISLSVVVTESGIRVRITGSTAGCYLVVDNADSRTLRPAVAGDTDIRLDEPAAWTSVRLYAA